MGSPLGLPLRPKIHLRLGAQRWTNDSRCNYPNNGLKLRKGCEPECQRKLYWFSYFLLRNGTRYVFIQNFPTFYWYSWYVTWLCMCVCAISVDSRQPGNAEVFRRRKVSDNSHEKDPISLHETLKDTTESQWLLILLVYGLRFGAGL